MELTEKNLKGFTKEVWYQKDKGDETFENLKFVEFTREIKDGFKFVVNFCYLAKEPEKFKQVGNPTCVLESPSKDTVLIKPDLEVINALYDYFTIEEKTFKKYTK